jgi:hypothetical protein
MLVVFEVGRDSEEEMDGNFDGDALGAASIAVVDGDW